MTSKPNAPWAGNPTQQGQDYITLADILSVQGSSEPGNSVNSLTVNLGVGYSGEIVTKNALLFQPTGVLALPLGPGSIDSSGNFVGSDVSKESAQAVAYVRNDQWIVLGTRDTRTQFTPGNLQPGETAVFATGSPAQTIHKLDGSVTMMTIAASDNTSQVYLSVSPTALTFMAPWGRLVFDATGFHVATQSGAQLDLSGIAAPGLGSLSSFCNINAGIVSIPASAVNLGPPGPLGYTQVVYSVAPGVPGIPLPPFTTTMCSSVYVGL